MKPDPKTTGRLAANRSPEEADALLKKSLDLVMKTHEANNILLYHKHQKTLVKVKEVRARIRHMFPEHVLNASLRKGQICAGLFIASMIGEAIVTWYTIGPFFYMTPIIHYVFAAMITILIFKGISGYIKHSIQISENKELELSNMLFQISVMVLVMILVLMGTSALIRKDISGAKESRAFTEGDLAQIENSYQEDIRRSQTFTEQNKKPFFTFLVLVGLMSAFIGGMSLYEASTRISSSKMHLAKYKELSSLEQDIDGLQTAMKENQLLVSTWQALFTEAFFMEKQRMQGR